MTDAAMADRVRRLPDIPSMIWRVVSLHCSNGLILRTLSSSAGLSAQMTHERTAGTYCVRVHDIGQLSVPVNFAIRI
jgi:hypothetical protein